MQLQCCCSISILTAIFKNVLKRAEWAVVRSQLPRISSEAQKPTQKRTDGGRVHQEKGAPWGVKAVPQHEHQIWWQQTRLVHSPVAPRKVHIDFPRPKSNPDTKSARQGGMETRHIWACSIALARTRGYGHLLNLLVLQMYVPLMWSQMRSWKFMILLLTLHCDCQSTLVQSKFFYLAFVKR